jgi:hypothetical protein
MMTEKFFLSPGEVSARLQVPSSIQRNRLAVSMFLLYIPKRRTRLWPSRYVNGLAKYLYDNMLPPIIVEARDFARLSETVELIKSIQAEFEAKLGRKKLFTTDETAAIFCVNRGTVGNWRTTGIIKSVPCDMQPKRDNSRGRLAEYLFPQKELRQIGEWKLPKT